MTKKYKLGSLFDGSGTAALVGQMCGIEPVWASEIEPFPIAVTHKRFPNMKHVGSITKLNGAELEPVDVICGGSPCTNLSQAGKREGLDNGAESSLFYEMVRVIKEMRDATNGRYPRYVLWENVTGAFSSCDGNDFYSVLQNFAQITQTDFHVPKPKVKQGKLQWRHAGLMEGDGWSIGWRTVDAQYWGVPQRRKRVYLVADLNGYGAREVLFERDGLRRDIEKSGVKGKTNARNFAESPVESNSKINNVVALEGNGARPSHKGDGYSDDGMMYTLNTVEKHSVAYVVDHHPMDSRERLCEDGVTPTLHSRMGTGGGNVPLVIEQCGQFKTR